MATIVTVHGTFAHVDESSGPSDPGVVELWWKTGSAFHKQITECLGGSDANGQAAPVKIDPFIWSGDNSEEQRRAAAQKLLDRLLVLEAAGEPYCLIGHSHGGSVVSTALLHAAASQKTMPNLRRWITVGTPFIAMRPLPALIERLALLQRVVLVASMMLLMMFVFYLGGQLTEQTEPFAATVTKLLSWRNLLAAAMMSVPAVLFTIIFKVIDHRHLYFYRRKTIERARATFTDRWLPLCHPSDEAVRGLQSLPRATIQVFDKSFLAHSLTLFATFILPISYLVVVTSPPLMLSITDVLKNKVYQVDKYAAESKQFEVARQRVRVAAKSLSGASDGVTAKVPGGAVTWTDVRRMREQLKAQYADHVQLDKALRFQRVFLERNGKPCDGGTLCGGGHDFAVNSDLLFHIVTDDVTSALINDDTRIGIYRTALTAAIPMLLVPLVFILLALLFTLLLSVVAKFVSAVVAILLNRVTLAELKREIYGNDTNGEFAFGAGPFPAWMTTGRPFLPDGIAKLLTRQSDTAASTSIAKFRDALSLIVTSTGQPPSHGIVSTYLSWKELIHSSYFELPEFRLLIARAIAAEKGFAALPALENNPDYAQTLAWLQAVDGAAGSAAAAVGPPRA